MVENCLRVRRIYDDIACLVGAEQVIRLLNAFGMARCSLVSDLSSLSEKDWVVEGFLGRDFSEAPPSVAIVRALRVFVVVKVSGFNKVVVSLCVYNQ